MILRHEVNGAVHFDLMLEVPGQDSLRTLQLARWPLGVGESCAASESAHHRRAYLDYEGEVSGGRGVVARVAAGQWADDAGLIVLDGVVALVFDDAKATRIR